MPISSLIVIPKEGGSEELARQIEEMEGAEVRGQSEEQIIVVTDTHTTEEDMNLIWAIEKNPGVERLHVVFTGLDESEIDKKSATT